MSQTVDEIEIKRDDADDKYQHRGYKDPQNALQHYASVFWNHNGPSLSRRCNWQGQCFYGRSKRGASYTAEYTTDGAIYKSLFRKSVVRSQWSAVSGRRSADGGQRTVVGGRWSADGGQWSVAGGK